MAKKRDAFRTISEVSDALDTPAHVLRFWESKFTQIKPVKRAGGRRYYRPDDLNLLAGIKTLLHEEGMTIKGAQKLLREKGVKHVMAIGEGTALSGDTPAEEQPAPLEVKAAMPPPPAAQTQLFPEEVAPKPEPEPAPQKLQILSASPFRAAPVPVSQPATKPTATIPAPRSFDDVGPRVLATATHAKLDRVRANAADIAPLLMRLAKLRDEMRSVTS